MNDAQIRKYRFEWNKARKVLRAAGKSPTEADARRHEIHIEALGVDKSSYDLTNKDFDAVLKLFQAISEPSSFTAQIHLEAMPESRMRFKIDGLLAALGKGRDHADALVESRRAAKRLVTVHGDAAADLDTLGEEDLRRVMLDLKRQCTKRWPRKGDLLTEIRLLRMEFEFDEQTTCRAVAKALKVEAAPDLNSLDYDNLLTVIGTLRTIKETAAPATSDPDWTV